MKQLFRYQSRSWTGWQNKDKTENKDMPVKVMARHRGCLAREFWSCVTRGSADIGIAVWGEWR